MADDSQLTDADKILRKIGNTVDKELAIAEMAKFPASVEVRDALIQAFELDPDTRVRIAAARALGNFVASDRSRLALARMLGDASQDPELREAIATAMASFAGTAEARSSLDQAAGDENFRVAAAARHALREVDRREQNWRNRLDSLYPQRS